MAMAQTGGSTRIEGNIHGRRRRAAAPPALDEADTYARARKLLGAGKHAEALAIIDPAVAAGARSPRLLILAGVASSALGRLADGDKCFHAALEAAPESLAAYRNLAANAGRRKDKAGMVAYNEKIVALDPDDNRARWRLAVAYFARKRYSEARDTLADFLAREPDHLGAQLEMVTLRAHLCDWSDYGGHVDAVRHCAEAEAPTHLPSPLYMLAWPGIDEATIQTIMTKRAARLSVEGEPFHPINSGRRKGKKPRGDKLKIGYLSCDFHEHPMMHLMADLFEAHDRERFETYAFAYDRDRDTPIRRCAKAAFDEFVDVRALSDRAAAQAIHDRGIDILIDRKGFTSDARLGILLHRPAPLIASFLAYPGTTGLAAIDYIIADPITIPRRSGRYFSERVAHMPVTYQPNVAEREVVAKTKRHDWGISEHVFVYACFNQHYKITPDVFAAWMTILGKVEGSVLWLWLDNAEAQRNLRRVAAEHGIGADRLIFAKTVKPAQHLARLALADVALDTAPYGSHTTGSDALRMGVPLVGLKGETFAGRVSGSLLAAYGMPELATERLDAYVDIAVKLGTNAKFRGRIRDKVAKKRETAYLFDPARFTRDLEALYEKMWAAYESGKMRKYLK